MLHCKLGGVESSPEAVAWSPCGHNHNRALSVPSVKSLAEVCLLGLCRNTGGRAASLNINHNKRKLSDAGKSKGLALKAQTRTGSRCHRHVAGIGRTNGCADSGDFVLALHCLYIQVLVYCKLFQDGCGRGDRIRAHEHRPSALLAGGYQSPGSSLVSVYAAVNALLKLCRRHSVGVADSVSVVGIVVTVVEHLDIRLDKIRLLGKLLLQILLCEVQRAVEHEIAHSKGEDVLAPYNGFDVHSAVFQALLCKRGDRSPYYVVILEIEFLYRIHCLEAGLLEALLVKGILVQDYASSGFSELGVCHKCSRIHRYENICKISRSLYIVVSDMHLKTGHS